jgi:hypothetical protein
MTSPHRPDAAILGVVPYSPAKLSAWANQVLEPLKAAGQEGVAALSFFFKNRIVKIGLRNQKSTGAM